MKQVCIVLSALLLTIQAVAAMNIEKIDPPFWYVGMENKELQLMVYGNDIANAKVDVSYPGVQISSTVRLESDNYLLVYLQLSDEVAPGNVKLSFEAGKRRIEKAYELKARTMPGNERKGFDASDALYLLMPDRFANGDTTNDYVQGMASYEVNRNHPDARHGGDLAGIEQHLDYFSELGVTALWFTPVLENNMPGGSYHGYATTDYYRVDPRFGSNELYCQMVEKAHEKGIKIIMDMVPNHCGSTHWWMADLPYKNWINQFDNFTNTINCFSANYDINASEYDRLLSNRGWFDRPMPDMNLENPDLLKYFQQWAIWWVEYANIDGMRVDTYPYVEKIPGSEWLAAIRAEYPNFNIVGECWTRPASAVAYWQSGVKNYDGFDSNLPTVMDFPVEEAIRQALEKNDNSWGAGLTKVYDAVSMDYLYADVNKLFTFLGNHDMARFADIVKDRDLRRVRLGYVLLATMRGIPQVFYGDEYAMTAPEDPNSHSHLRMPLPLGDQVTKEQQEMYDFQSALFQWRKNEPVLHTGRTMHFLSRDNTYGFFRYNENEAVFVFANAAEEARTIPTANYKEITSKYNTVGVNPLTGETIDLSKTDITVPALSTLIVKLTK